MHDPSSFPAVMERHPHAMAEVHGSAAFPQIRGTVRFYQTRSGVVTVSDILGLPAPAEACQAPVIALHIHRGESCTGNTEDPFADALTHYNPGNCPHPYHAGDLPPLFGCNGRAFQASLTNRFTVAEILGLTIVLHEHPDDFTTQPAGNSGRKIACGEICAGGYVPDA